MFPEEIQYCSDASQTKNFKSFLYPKTNSPNRTELRHFLICRTGVPFEIQIESKISKSMHFLNKDGKDNLAPSATLPSVHFRTKSYH